MIKAIFIIYIFSLGNSAFRNKTYIYELYGPEPYCAFVGFKVGMLKFSTLSLLESGAHYV